jgi:hypothetical protein
MNEYKSLYEYLGHAAGSDLGKAVATAAGKQKIKITSHEVSNPKYTGTILMYPITFLDEYFGKNNTPNVSPVESDDLPF